MFFSYTELQIQNSYFLNMWTNQETNINLTKQVDSTGLVYGSRKLS